jgi:hypothetical protein
MQKRFMRCSSPERLQELADSLTSRDPLQCRLNWPAAFAQSFTSAEGRQGGSRHRPFFSQAEYRDNLIFFRCAAVDEMAERLVDMDRTIG